MFKIRMAIHIITTPIRCISGMINHWINSSKHMSADWLRRVRLNQLTKKDN